MTKVELNKPKYVAKSFTDGFIHKDGYGVEKIWYELGFLNYIRKKSQVVYFESTKSISMDYHNYMMDKMENIAKVLQDD